MRDISISWPWNCVAYQIYPRSFKDSNGDGIGDLPGITEKLDYLNDGSENSLGIGAIWISPFFPSPMRDFGYDVSDYCGVDPTFGTLDDFDRLVREAHRRNIKVIIDFVPNHTSDQHPWFIESCSSLDNIKRDWYVWKDPKPDGGPPNNWRSVFGGSAWAFDARTRQYYLHSFLKEQPDLNWFNPAVKEAMKNVLRFWFDRGADGIRVDAVEFLAKDELFRDDPPNPDFKEGKSDPYSAALHAFSKNQPKLFGILNELTAVISEYPERFMVTEVYPEEREKAAEYVKFYRNCDNTKTSPFNFEALSLPWQANEYKKFIDKFQSALQPEDLPIYVLGNHDRSRLASRIGQEQSRVAAMMLLSLPGMPFIYYGEEIGMEDAVIPEDKIQDPFEKNVPGIGVGRDPARTPMQWSDEKFAGFSNREPWLPISQLSSVYNVKAQSVNSNSFLFLYRALIHYRNNSKPLRFGAYNPLSLSHNSIFGYERAYKNEKIAVFLNFSAQQQQLSLKGRRRVRAIISTYLDQQRGTQIDLNRLSLRPNEGLLCELE